MMELPHSSIVQVVGQPSQYTMFPSSHCSPASTWRSPHTVQLSLHRLWLPPAGDPGGSHVSPIAVSTMPTPHLGVVQLLRHPSASLRLPSSHSSPVSTMASPHTCGTHRFGQASVSTPL